MKPGIYLTIRYETRDGAALAAVPFSSVALMNKAYARELARGDDRIIEVSGFVKGRRVHYFHRPLKTSEAAANG